MKNSIINFDQYQMRLIEVNDTDAYYKKAFLESDAEAKFFTGTVNHFTKEQITSYVETIVKNENRYDFIIMANDEIIGEVVLSDIEKGNCHYRICLFNKQYFSKGIGFKATKIAFEYVFSELELDTIELEVFPFNERGIALYKKMGFEHVDRIVDDEAEEPYQAIYTMRLKRENFNELI